MTEGNVKKKTETVVEWMLLGVGLSVFLFLMSVFAVAR